MLLHGKLFHDLSNVLLSYMVIRMCFFEHIKAIDPCQDEHILSNICESPCVAQVGLSIVRVTINNFHANSKCVETASILYWKTNSSKTMATEVRLNDVDAWRQDCTYGIYQNNKRQLAMKNKINTAKQAKDASSTLREMVPPKKANGKYTYLHGLAIGGEYYFKLKIQLTSNFGGRSIFYSHQDTISLSSSTKLFKDDGLVGNVNQGSCCNMQSSFQYLVNKWDGECILKPHPHQSDHSANTFMLFLLIFILLAIVIVNMVFHFKKLLMDRRYYQRSRIENAEVAFMSIDTEDQQQHPDILAPNYQNNLNETLLRNSTITIRLPPNYEHNSRSQELLFEELKNRLSTQSI